jgi:cysteine desulfurase
MTIVYLDYNATTPLDPRVLDTMLPWMREPSNAGSRTHALGQRAKTAVETARGSIASVVGVGAEDVVLTSGATESNNIAILGLAEFGKRSGRTHVLSTTIEHKAVLEPMRRLAGAGFEVEYLPVTNGGWVRPEEVLGRVRADTLLVSVMHANNETGVLQPVKEIGEGLRKSQVLFHIDAAQSFGKELSLREVPFDMLSVSGHKIFGPQGIGALVVRRQKFDRRELSSLVAGGGQERGLRPGTVPVALAVGLGKAAELAVGEHSQRRSHASALKSRFLKELAAVEFELNGDAEHAQPHVLNVSFPGVDSEALMMALRDSVAISNGSACTSSQYAPSHVLKAMGIDEDRIAEAVRLSWGSGVDRIPGEVFVNAVRQLRH